MHFKKEEIVRENKINLLIVDDEERFLFTSKTLFEKRGLNVLTATNGLDALKVLDEHRIEVVILDVKMPGMNGIDVLRKIKKKFPLIEVILITGHASVESAVEGIQLGAFDYIAKPCDISELLSKIQEAFGKQQTMKEKTSKIKVN